MNLKIECTAMILNPQCYMKIESDPRQINHLLAPALMAVQVFVQLSKTLCFSSSNKVFVLLRQKPFGKHMLNEENLKVFHCIL